MSPLAPSAEGTASVLAFATTMHLAFVLLRRHRSAKVPGGLWLLLPGLALTASPWLLSSWPWLATCLVAHLAWFVACEKLVPVPAPPPRPAAAPPKKPAPPPRPAKPAAPAGGAQAGRDSHGFIAVPVLAVFGETDDIKTFRIGRPDGFTFSAGQFITVRVQVDGRPLVRCYSISSAPEVAGYLEISVKRQGVVSRTLHGTLRPGSLLHIKGPAGSFTFPAGDDRPIVYLAGGVGVTPLMSMFRHGLATQPGRLQVFIHAARDERGIVFKRELDWLPERNPQVKTAVVVSQGPRAEQHLSGRINEQLLSELVPDVQYAIYMLCGPGPMMDAMRKMLSDMGVPDDQVRHEAFQAAIALADLKPAAIAASSPEEAEPASEIQEPAARAGACKLTLQASGVTVPVARGQTLLEAAEAGGVSLPSSCRVGVCLSCRQRVTGGQVKSESDGLDESDRAEGFVLPCVTTAESDCTMDA